MSKDPVGKSDAAYSECHQGEVITEAGLTA